MCIRDRLSSAQATLGQGQKFGGTVNPGGLVAATSPLDTGFGKSLESDTLRHGLFTYYLLRGLRGEADLNRNGEVTIGEVTDYLTRKIPTCLLYTSRCV